MTVYVKWLVVIGMLFTLAPAGVAAEGQAMTFSMESREAGDQLEVVLLAHQSRDVYAYELDITFDANRLKLNQATADHNGFMVAPITENNQIRIAHTLIGPKAGLNKSIELVSLAFERIAPGDATVSLDRVKLVDSEIESKTYRPKIAKLIADHTIDFIDIEGHWAEGAIGQAVRLDLITGYPDGAFRPQRAVSRAEFAVLLARASDLPTASSGTVSASDAEQIPAWAAASIASAMKAGWIRGYEDGSFRSGLPITRAEMAVMAARFTGGVADGPASTGFADQEQIPAWSQSAVAQARELGIVRGRSGNRFAPDEHATRAEAVALLLNILAL